MKKLGFLFVLAIGMFLTYMPANAQSTTAQVSTTVQTALSITKSQDIKFGNISATSSPVLDPTGATNTDVGSTAQVGIFDISGANSGTIYVHYDANVSLTGPTGTPTPTITFTPNVTGDVSSSNQSGSTSVGSGSTVSLSSTGAYTLWVGGNLGTLSSQTAGSYTGTFNINVYYQ